MKIIICLLPAVFCFKLSSQVFQIKNQLTDKPVPFATVIFPSGGLYASDSGYFKIPDSLDRKELSNDSIQIFCLGYKPLKTSVSGLTHTIFLKPSPIELEEVKLYSNYEKKKFIGYNKKVKHQSFFGSFPLKPKTELVCCVKPQKIYRNASIKKVYIHLAKGRFFKNNGKIKKGKIRINFYSMQNGLPGDPIYSSRAKDYLFGKSRKTVVEHIEKFLPYLSKGFCIGVESLGYFDGSKFFLEDNLNETAWARVLTPRKEIEDFKSTLYLKSLLNYNKFYSFDSIIRANYKTNNSKSVEKKPKSFHWNMAIGFDIVNP